MAGRGLVTSFTPNGLVSPGNASEIADGAGALVVVDRDVAEKQGMPARYEIEEAAPEAPDPGT